MRAVEDHHVDRLGVEEEQSLQLTSTNRSIGLIYIHASFLKLLFLTLLYLLKDTYLYLKNIFIFFLTQLLI